jgi:hypothetical protein
VGVSSAGFAVRLDAAVVVRRVVVLVVFLVVVLRLFLVRRGRPDMDLSLVPRHGKRPHRRNV